MAISNWLKYIEYDFALPAIAKLPPRLAYYLADLRGSIVFKNRVESRRYALENVRSVFPELSLEDALQVVRRHYQVRSEEDVEGFWAQRGRAFLQRRVELRGLDLLEQAVASRRGALLFSGHLGSTGIFFAAVGKSGVPMNIIGRSIEPGENPLHPAAFRYNRKRVAWAESAVQRPYILTGRGKYPEMKARLQAGEIVMLLIDVLPILLRRTVPVTFFGRQAYFGDGIASLYLETGAPVFQWTIHREGNQHAEIEDVTPLISGLREQQPIMQVLVSRLEKKIRAHPGHWHAWDSLTHFYTPPASPNR